MQPSRSSDILARKRAHRAGYPTTTAAFRDGVAVQLDGAELDGAELLELEELGLSDIPAFYWSVSPLGFVYAHPSRHAGSHRGR